MKTEFNHAANDSPRSGSSKNVTLRDLAHHRRFDDRGRDLAWHARVK